MKFDKDLFEEIYTCLEERWFGDSPMKLIEAATRIYNHHITVVTNQPVNND